ncbi:hypothetical protein HVY71_12575 [Citrobacter freundii]|nr:hypothetical protein HVY71_12575 [Citrobacter freundii]
MTLSTNFTPSLYTGLVDRREKAERSFLWQRRYKNKLLRISLRTKEKRVAVQRYAQVTSAFIQLKSIGVSGDALHASLCNVRDKAVDQYALEALSDALGGSVSVSNAMVQHKPVEAVTEAPVKAMNTSPLLSDVLDEWVREMDGEWAERTKKLNKRVAMRFIEWKGDVPISIITKKDVSQYKAYLEQKYEAPRTRQDALIKASGILTFAVNKRDYIVKNPFHGMFYKNLENTNEKESVTKEEHKLVCDSLKDEELKWMLHVLWYTGMRIGEVIQLRPEDYREIDGVPCFSVNTEDGKTLKTSSSIRDIPIHSDLIEMGIMEVKPTFHWKKSNSAGERINQAFKSIELKRTAHCYRYAMSDRLRELSDIPDHVRFTLLGHAHKTTTDRIYRSKQPIELMKNAIDRT